MNEMAAIKPLDRVHFCLRFAMPPQDLLRKGHAAARDDATVHGQPPMPVVMDGHGKERSEGSTRML